MSEFEVLIEQAKRIEEKLAATEKAQGDGKADLAKVQEALAKLGEEQASLGRKLVVLQQESTVKASTGQQTATLGAQFVASTAYADLMSGKTQKAVLAAASPVTTPAGSVPADYQGLKAEPELPATIVAAFPHVTTTSNSISYLKEKAFTNAAAEVAEGAVKPESMIEFEAADAPVRTIPHFIRVTKQLAEDAPALAAYINSRMMYGLARRIEKQLLLGDGTGANLKGVLTDGNYTPHGFTEDTMPAGSTVLDLIRRCAATMRKTGYQPNAVFLSPMDFDTLRGMKDQNGNYIMGSPLQAGTDIRPWGLQVVESAEMTEGKFLVADTRMGATVYDRTPPVLEMFEQDVDNVQRNLYTVRVEQRMAFAVETANAFIGGDLAIGKAASGS
ncbi:MAG: phage major capsid protein [Sutterella sp.]|nr:phage major capsid protein [Sutterella sp.]